MPNESLTYISYLLRLWKSNGDEQPTWRASLESPLDRQQVNFASFEALLDFLVARFGQAEEEQAGAPATDHADILEGKRE